MQPKQPPPKPTMKSLSIRVTKLGRIRFILFLICMVTVLFIGEQNEMDSCVRSKVVRSSVEDVSTYFAIAAQRANTRAKFERGELGVIDRREAATAQKVSMELRVRQLKCSFPFPSTH